MPMAAEQPAAVSPGLGAAADTPVSPPRSFVSLPVAGGVSTPPAQPAAPNAAAGSTPRATSVRRSKAASASPPNGGLTPVQVRLPSAGGGNNTNNGTNVNNDNNYNQQSPAIGLPPSFTAGFGRRESAPSTTVVVVPSVSPSVDGAPTLGPSPLSGPGFVFATAQPSSASLGIQQERSNRAPSGDDAGQGGSGSGSDTRGNSRGLHTNAAAGAPPLPTRTASTGSGSGPAAPEGEDEDVICVGHRNAPAATAAAAAPAASEVPSPPPGPFAAAAATTSSGTAGATATPLAPVRMSGGIGGASFDAGVGSGAGGGAPASAVPSPGATATTSDAHGSAGAPAALPTAGSGVAGGVAGGGGGKQPYRQWRQATLTTAKEQQTHAQMVEQLRKEAAEAAARNDELAAQVRQAEEGAQRHAAMAEASDRRVAAVEDAMRRHQTVIRGIMIEQALSQRRDARREQHQLHFELGQISTINTINGPQEMWVHGNRYREIMAELDAVSKRQREVETWEKEAKASRRGASSKLTRILNSVSAAVANASGAAAVAGSDGGDDGGTVTAAGHGNSNPLPVSSMLASVTAACNTAGPPPGSGDNNAACGSAGGGTAGPSGASCAERTPQDLMESLFASEEMAQIHGLELLQLRARHEALLKERDDLDSRRVAFMKEIRRIDDEDHSPYAALATMGPQGRYVLQCLLGKGGFSEVWKAFDLVEARFVACKVHHIDRKWTQQTKHHYLRHAERELSIQRALEHPRLVRLFDVFEHDESTFVSVMEHCGGCDLDTHLKRVKTMRECDARVIMLQIVSGLRHLSELESAVIHYDLKPANILFASHLQSCLEVKITDFGLSKVLSAEGNSSDPDIELTSQGTGTFWYLPPECFETNYVPRISGKVDIWATGVIFYQMLYGRKPFADGEPQRRIWSEKLIGKQVRNLEFPARPVVSPEAQALIRRCLAERPADRPDIGTLSNDPYLCTYVRNKRPRDAASSAAGSTTTAATATSAPHFAVPAAVVPGTGGAQQALFGSASTSPLGPSFQPTAGLGRSSA